MKPDIIQMFLKEGLQKSCLDHVKLKQQQK